MKLLKLFLITLAVCAISCGDSTRNDQGMSFTFFGWFTDVDGAEGAVSARVPLTGAGVGNNSVVLYGGLQNNMPNQFIRIERAFHKYTVPGSNIRIPSTSVGVASFARPAPAATEEEGGATSTLPSNALSDENATYAGAHLIPASVGEYISLNRNQLPRAPFQMIVTTYFEGVTSSGRRIQSNPIQFEIEVVSDFNLVGGGAGGEEAEGEE